MAMKTRLLHISAGDIRGLVLDAIGAEVNALSQGAIKLGTVNGQQANAYSALFSEGALQFDFWPLYAHIVVKSATLIIGVPTLSIGITGPNYVDIVPATILTGLTLLGKQAVFTPQLGAGIAAYGSDVYANVSGVAVGTELTLSVSLIGVMNSP